MMGRGLQPDQPSGWDGEVPGAACVPISVIAYIQWFMIRRKFRF